MGRTEVVSDGENAGGQRADAEVRRDGLLRTMIASCAATCAAAIGTERTKSANNGFNGLNVWRSRWRREAQRVAPARPLEIIEIKTSSGHRGDGPVEAAGTYMKELIKYPPKFKIGVIGNNPPVDDMLSKAKEAIERWTLGQRLEAGD